MQMNQLFFHRRFVKLSRADRIMETPLEKPEMPPGPPALHIIVIALLFCIILVLGLVFLYIIRLCLKDQAIIHHVTRLLKEEKEEETDQLESVVVETPGLSRETLPEPQPETENLEPMITENHRSWPTEETVTMSVDGQQEYWVDELPEPKSSEQEMFKPKPEEHESEEEPPGLQSPKPVHGKWLSTVHELPKPKSPLQAVLRHKPQEHEFETDEEEPLKHPMVSSLDGTMEKSEKIKSEVTEAQKPPAKQKISTFEKIKFMLPKLKRVEHTKPKYEKTSSSMATAAPKPPPRKSKKATADKPSTIKTETPKEIKKQLPTPQKNTMAEKSPKKDEGQKKENGSEAGKVKGSHVLNKKASKEKTPKIKIKPKKLPELNSIKTKKPKSKAKQQIKLAPRFTRFFHSRFLDRPNRLDIDLTPV